MVTRVVLAHQFGVRFSARKLLINMTKEEINNWMANAKIVDREEHYNSEGDGYEFTIYEKDGKFYHLDTYDRGKPIQLSKNDYAEPFEVQRHTRIIEEVYYE